MEPRILRIGLLGEPSLRLGDTSLPALEFARAESLLAYLLLHRDAPQQRQHLAFLLWPDSTEAQARTNLRHVLHTLRQALPDGDRYLEVTPRTLRWRPDAPFWFDVAAFEDALHRGALGDAVEIYSGDLLRGSYDEWVLEDRARLQGRLVDALAALCATRSRASTPTRFGTPSDCAALTRAIDITNSCLRSYPHGGLAPALAHRRDGQNVSRLGLVLRDLRLT